MYITDENLIIRNVSGVLEFVWNFPQEGKELEPSHIIVKRNKKNHEYVEFSYETLASICIHPCRFENVQICLILLHSVQFCSCPFISILCWGNYRLTMVHVN